MAGVIFSTEPRFPGFYPESEGEGRPQGHGVPGTKALRALPPSSGDGKPSAMGTEVKIVRDWDVDVFHRRVLELEAAGYTTRRESYTVTAEMNPATGEISHLHSIEMMRSTGAPDARAGREP